MSGHRILNHLNFWEILSYQHSSHKTAAKLLVRIKQLFLWGSNGGLLGWRHYERLLPSESDELIKIVESFSDSLWNFHFYLWRAELSLQGHLLTKSTTVQCDEGKVIGLPSLTLFLWNSMSLAFLCHVTSTFSDQVHFFLWFLNCQGQIWIT